MRRRFAGVILVVGVVAPLVPGPVPAAAWSVPALPSDFNGDGYADLAIGSPSEDIGGVDGAGTVTVLHGSANGLMATAGQRWSQATAGVKGAIHSADYFGSALASGDFDGDGFADLAIGAYGDWLGPVGRHAGAVNVLYGTRRGLSADGDQRFTRTTIGGSPDRHDTFGWSLAAGDFDGDGRDDLVIGDPSHAIGDVPDTGSLVVLRGGSGGLTTTGIYELDLSAFDTSITPGTEIGRTLAVGDLDADGRDDLAISVDSSLGDWSSGRVGIVFGVSGGLDGTRTQLVRQGVDGVPGIADPRDAFGYALAIGDFDGDGHDDLAAGDELEPPEPATGETTGVLVVVPGASAGLDTSRSTMWSVADVSLFGTPTSSDAWPYELAAGDLNGDGAADLAAGSMVNSRASVIVMYGAAGGGLHAVDAQAWSPATPGVPGAARAGTCFGTILAIASYGRTEPADLAVGDPCWSSPDLWNIGHVTVLYGRAAGLSAAGAQMWSQDSPGVPGHAGWNDTFGAAVSP